MLTLRNLLRTGKSPDRTSKRMGKNCSSPRLTRQAYYSRMSSSTGTTPQRPVDGSTAATVLVAEDDRGVRTSLERALGYEGYEVITATDGAEALAAVDAHHPALVVLDVMRPHVDGLAAVRRMRQRGDRTPVLLPTARHEVADRVAGLDAAPMTTW